MGCLVSIIEGAIDAALLYWIVGIAGMKDSTGLLVAVIIFGIVQFTEGIIHAHRSNR